jgi:hypothetical protein
VDNELNLRESFITNAYVWMKHHSLSDIDAWGLEEADTHLEKVPLVLKPSQKVKLTRVLPSGVGADPNELEEEIESFETNVDWVLSEVNGKTVIQV